MSEMIRVGMAEYKLCTSPDQISTLGLGSCLGVVICDSDLGLCGLAHIMLPDSTRISKNGNRMKFADTCLDDMYCDLVEHGAKPSSLYAKLAGGAKMFAYQTENELLNIGEQNVQAVHRFLQRHHIPIKAEDVGENYGRTIVFCPEDGSLHVTVFGKGELVI